MIKNWKKKKKKKKNIFFIPIPTSSRFKFNEKSLGSMNIEYVKFEENSLGSIEYRICNL